MSYVRDRMAAEDIVTDSFMAWWENRETTDVRHIPAYILTGVRNRCKDYLDAYRQHAEAQQQIRSVAYRLARQNIISWRVNESQALLFEEVGAIIERELRRMPDRMRRIFIAHRYEEMSYKEIAAVYSLSEGQVHYELRKACETLKVALKDYAPALLMLFLH